MNMGYEELLDQAFGKIQKKSAADRFNIPQLFLEQQGTKTVIKNFIEAANAIRRDPNHLAKYFSKELAAPNSIQGESLVMQAKVSRDSLEKKFSDYMKEYLYCKVCGEPDTKLIKEDRITFMVCEACGAKTPTK